MHLHASVLLLAASLWTAHAGPVERDVASGIAFIVKAAGLQPFCRQILAQVKPTRTVFLSSTATSTSYVTTSPTLSTQTVFTPSASLTTSPVQAVTSTTSTILASQAIISYSTATSYTATPSTSVVVGPASIETDSTTITQLTTAVSIQLSTTIAATQTQTVRANKLRERQALPFQLAKMAVQDVLAGCALALGTTVPPQVATSTKATTLGVVCTVTKPQTASVTSPSASPVTIFSTSTSTETDLRTSTSTYVVVSPTTVILTTADVSTVTSTPLSTTTATASTLSTVSTTSTQVAVATATVTKSVSCQPITGTSPTRLYSLSPGASESISITFTVFGLDPYTAYNTETRLIISNSGGNTSATQATTIQLAGSDPIPADGTVGPATQPGVASPNSASIASTVTVSNFSGGSSSGSVAIQVTFTPQICS